MAKNKYKVSYKKNTLILTEKDIKNIIQLLGKDANKILKIEPVKTFNQESFIDSILKADDEPATEVEDPAEEEPKKITITEKLNEIKNK